MVTYVLDSQHVVSWDNKLIRFFLISTDIFHGKYAHNIMKTEKFLNVTNF